MMKRWAFTLTLVAVLTLGLAGGAAAFDSPEFWYFYDGADDIDEFWTRTAVNRSDIFIIDSSEVFEGEGTPQGTFRLFADPSRHVEGDGVRFANAYFDVAPVLSWDLGFRAQFRSPAARAADAPLSTWHLSRLCGRSSPIGDASIWSPSMRCNSSHRKPGNSLFDRSRHRGRS
jgi:hypothetical protein